MSRRLMGILLCAWCNYTRDPDVVPASELSAVQALLHGGCVVISLMATGSGTGFRHVEYGLLWVLVPAGRQLERTQHPQHIGISL